jgi:hypothetical protein
MPELSSLEPKPARYVMDINRGRKAGLSPLGLGRPNDGIIGTREFDPIPARYRETARPPKNMAS